MISSNQNERVKYWVSLKEKKNRDDAKEYIIEGEHLVLEAYKNGYLKTVLHVGELKENYKNVEIVEISENVMKKISTTQTPQKIAGVAKYFEDINWYLMKEVDPITYFAKIVQSLTVRGMQDWNFPIRWNI